MEDWRDSSAGHVGFALVAANAAGRRARYPREFRPLNVLRSEALRSQG